jgi:putative endonuclease
MAKHNEIGSIGEDIASNWLIQKGFSILERNYRRKWGEIDIVSCETTGKTHFIEVKTVSYETKLDHERAVSHGMYRPEENVHKEKQQRLSRAIQTWLLDNNYHGEWQIDILTVRLVSREKYCQVKFIDNVIFDLD